MTTSEPRGLVAGLHPDLAPHVIADPFGGHMIHHPLLCQTLFPEAIEQTNKTDLSRSRGLAEAESRGDWLGYVFRHERPYRLDALQEIEGACTWDVASPGSRCLDGR